MTTHSTAPASSASSGPTGSGRTYDVTVVGGGHNGLAAAAFLAGAGLGVLVLERQDRVGGAAVSAQAFPGLPARLSRYSYLVSLMPEQVARELELPLELRSRRTASYSPTLRDGRPVGLFVEHEEGEATRQSFRALTGGEEEYAAWREFYAEVGRLAHAVAPSLTEPLRHAADLRAQVPHQIWNDVVERPLGEAVERRFADDLVRGVVATDGLIGTFAGLHDPSLVQNRCFLYHLVGNGTGEWRVPVGGMGSVTTALAKVAAERGAELVTGAEVTHVETGPGGAEVAWRGTGGAPGGTARSRFVLANVSPWTLDRLRGRAPGAGSAADKPEGAQLKLNLLLSRLPRLRSGVEPQEAWAGTFHVAEEYTDLQRSYEQAATGTVPTRPPGEFYCHSLTDPSVLGDLNPTGDPGGVHTLTYFGLHMPARLFTEDREAARERAVRRAIAAIDEHLVEPLMDCVLTGPDGRPCLEAKVPQDVEDDLGMPGGHIFHGDLAWPWLDDGETATTPADRWGVATDDDAILLCGSGARRGGAVSALGGRDAAHAVLETLGG